MPLRAGKLPIGRTKFGFQLLVSTSGSSHPPKGKLETWFLVKTGVWQSHPSMQTRVVFAMMPFYNIWQGSEFTLMDRGMFERLTTDSVP